MNSRNKKRLITLLVALILVLGVGSFGYIKWKDYSGEKIYSEGIIIGEGKSTKGFSLEKDRKYLDLRVNVDDVAKLSKGVKVCVYNPLKEKVFEYELKGNDVLTKITLEGMSGEWTLELINEEGKSCGISYEYRHYNVK
ncbi:MAG: hypothetical protein ACRC7N_12065 [Clostridium sp.]